MYSRIYFQTAVSVQIVTVSSFTIPPFILKNISELYAVFMPLVSFSVIMNQPRDDAQNPVTRHKVLSGATFYTYRR